MRQEWYPPAAPASKRGQSSAAWAAGSHGPVVLDETWAIFEAAVARASNLRAVVVECERNPIAAVLPIFERVAAIWS